MESDRSVQIAGSTAVPQALQTKEVKKDADSPDISSLFDPESEVQHPHELLHHVAATFAHHMDPDKHKHPGSYKGPGPVMPDWFTPEDEQEQQQSKQQESIANIARKSPAPPAKVQGPPLPGMEPKIQGGRGDMVSPTQPYGQSIAT